MSLAAGAAAQSLYERCYRTEHTHDESLRFRRSTKTDLSYALRRTCRPSDIVWKVYSSDSTPIIQYFCDNFKFVQRKMLRRARRTFARIPLVIVELSDGSVEGASVPWALVARHWYLLSLVLLW